MAELSDEILRHAALDARMVKVARGIRLLNLVSWPASEQQRFLACYEAGTLDPNRFANFLKLRDEVAGAADKLATRLQQKSSDKVQTKSLYNRIDEKYGRH